MQTATGETVDETTGEIIEEPITEEAAREQADDGDEHGDGTPDATPDATPAEPEPEPDEQPGALSQKMIDARVQKLERASATYTKKVAEILGDDLSDFVASPLSLPFLFGFVFNPSTVPLDEEVVNATKALIGEPVPPPLRQDPEARECSRCEGWGRVLTGSKVHGRNTVNCPTCKGTGWVGELRNVTPAQAAQGITPDTLDLDAEAAPLLAEDNWGTPLGHPDYGKMPQYREPGWAEALAAYRNGQSAPVA